MTDSLERFLQDLHFDVPAEMVERAKAAAFDAAWPQRARRATRRSRRVLDTDKHLWAQALVAVLLAIAIVAALLFVGHQHSMVPVSPGPHPTTRYTIPSPPPVASGCTSLPRQWASSPPQPAMLLSTTTGWAFGPMRTTDGGAHWLDVSPPSVPGRTPKNDEYFLDATHAWVAETVSSPKACVDHVVVFSTADGGLTWQQAAPIHLQLAVPTDVIWTGGTNHAGLFVFSNSLNGWFLLGSGPVVAPGADPAWTGATWRVGDLYRTTDGGLHWTLATTNPGSAVGCSLGDGSPVGPAMAFSSASTGWIMANCPGPDHPELLVTHDGGVTWRLQVLPVTPWGVPIFFDRGQGLIFVKGGILVTSDGGANWNVRATLPADAYAIDFMSASEGWALGPGAHPSPVQCGVDNLDACNGNFELYRTTDGGKTWVLGATTSLLMPAPKYWPPAYLHFVDSKTGFLDPGGPVEGFFKTTDGGHTWAAVNGTVQRP